MRCAKAIESVRDETPSLDLKAYRPTRRDDAQAAAARRTRRPVTPATAPALRFGEQPSGPRQKRVAAKAKGSGKGRAQIRD